MQIHNDRRDWAPDPFGELDRLPFFPCQRLQPWQQTQSHELSIIPAATKTSGFVQAWPIGWLSTEAW